MNRNILKHYSKEAFTGLMRYGGPALAAAALVFAAMLALGLLLFARSALGGFADYMNSQISIKAYVEQGYEAEQIAAALNDNAFVGTVRVETRDEALAQLERFFAGKPYLLEAFRHDSFPDAVLIDLRDNAVIGEFAAELQGVPGLLEVVYPQQFAKQWSRWLGLIETYGAGALLLLLFTAGMTVFMAIRLALYQRDQEIRVKLLIGALPMHVKAQFALEGLLIGIAGTLPAAFLLLRFSSFLWEELHRQFPLLLQAPANTLYPAIGLLFVIGPLLSLVTSLAAVCRRVDHV